MKTTADIDLDTPVLTRREALDMAYERLTSVVIYCLDAGLEPDAMDKDSIRTAHRMVNLALRTAGKPAPAETPVDTMRAVLAAVTGSTCAVRVLAEALALHVSDMGRSRTIGRYGPVDDLQDAARAIGEIYEATDADVYYDAAGRLGGAAVDICEDHGIFIGSPLIKLEK